MCPSAWTLQRPWFIWTFCCWWIQKPTHIYLCTFVRNCWFIAKGIFHLDPDTICSWFKLKYYRSICRKTHPCWQGLLLIKKNPMTQISLATCPETPTRSWNWKVLFFWDSVPIGIQTSSRRFWKISTKSDCFFALSLIQFSNELDILFKFCLFVSTCWVYH